MSAKGKKKSLSVVILVVNDELSNRIRDALLGIVIINVCLLNAEWLNGRNCELNTNHLENLCESMASGVAPAEPPVVEATLEEFPALALVFIIAVALAVILGAEVITRLPSPAGINTNTLFIQHHYIKIHPSPTLNLKNTWSTILAPNLELSQRALIHNMILHHTNLTIKQMATARQLQQTTPNILL
jgi:hypothetical protein